MMLTTWTRPGCSGFADMPVEQPASAIGSGWAGARRLLPPPAARVVLNLLLLAAESLPGGGIVALSGSPAHSIRDDDRRSSRRMARRPGGLCRPPNYAERACFPQDSP